MTWHTLAHAREHADFGRLTTYRVGGPADVMVTLHHVDEVARLASAWRDEHRSIYVLGKGSNTLVSDAGFRGVVVTLGEEFATLESRDEGDDVIVTLGGAIALPVAARRLVEAGVTGFEWAVGVPGSLGGAVAMNAGGHGSDIATNLIDALVGDLTTGMVTWRDAQDLSFGYRHSSVAATDVVLAARLRLHRGDPEVGRARLSEIVRWRRDHQPGGANAGSVFTNPPGEASGQLIEAAGLKGFRIGTAHVSTKHANFIQADDEGRGDDVKAVMDAVREAVRETSAIDLHTEIRLVGFAQ
jgi:UDP-N-acetylmuramate dehydrogenase